MRADLHMHTTESDGLLSREALFAYAKEKGLDLISITDHDTCKHVEDNRRLAKKYNIHYIPGIELSTLYDNKNVHVLGYFRDESYQSKMMLDYYKTIKKGREERAKKFIKNLKKYHNITITYQRLLDISHGIIARPHIAKAILEAYPEYTHNGIFETLIGDFCKAYVKSTELSLQAGIDLLRKHNAVIVLAHPKLLKKSIHDAVCAHNYDGIEAIYGLNTESEIQYYKTLAKKRQMIITAGSDYHGIKNDTKHRDLGDVSLTGDDLTAFLNCYNKTHI